MLRRIRGCKPIPEFVRCCGAALDAASPRALGVYLFLTTVLVFLLTQVNVIGGDSPPTVYLPVTLLRWGTFRLDPLIGKVFNLFDVQQHNYHYLIYANGHYYSKFSPLTAIVVLPLYALYLGLGGKPDNYGAYLGLSRVAATLLCATNVILLFGVLRRLLPQRRAWLLSLVYAFGTFTWAFATNTLATQATAELFFLLALGKLFDLGKSKDAGSVVVPFQTTLVGLFLALAVAARTQVLPVALLLYLGVVLIGRWRAGFWAALGGLPVGVLWGLYNTLAFGAPWRTGYGSEAGAGWITPLFEGLTGILFSPAHGLLMYSPVLLLAFAGAWVVWRHRGLSTEGPNVNRLLRLISISCLLFLLMMSHWWAWHGGNAYNQRMLQEIHPLIIILVGCAWQALGEQRAFCIIFVLASAWSVFMNVVRVTFYDLHLEFVEFFRPELVWSWSNCELAMYMHWHGVAGFTKELTLTVVKIGLLVAATTVELGLELFLFKNAVDYSH